MKEKTFWIVLYATVGLCLALTAAHLAYAIYAYDHASIIYFIGEELW